MKEKMEAKTENLNGGKVKLLITVSPKEMAVYFNKSFEKIAPTIRLDGFRPGKAPRKLIESTAGISRLLSEGLDMAVQYSYAEAVRNNKLIPLTSPSIVINKYPNYGHEESEVKDIFEYEVELEVLPEVKLEDYSKEKVSKGTPKKPKKEDVDKVVDHFRKQGSTFKDVETPAKKGNRVEIDFEGFLKKVRIDSMCSKHFPLILGESTLIPGFEDHIIGMKKDEEKEFKIAFPKDYHSKEFAGKEAEFKVKVLDIKEIILPELDNKFAEKFGHKDMVELKKAIEENLQKEMDEEYKRDLEGKVLDKILPYLKTEIPESLISRETERMIGDFGSQVVSQGVNFDKYLESMKKTKDDLKKDMTSQAEKNVKVGLILGKIIEEKKWDQHSEGAGKKALDYLVEQIAK